MARRIPEDRFDQLVDRACEVFISRGYRLTQMSDVAAAVGVAKGTIYGYVESKEALFALCLLHADRKVPLEHPASLPYKTPRRGEVAALLEQRLGDETIPRSLSDALGRERVGDPRAELESIVREFYGTLEHFCRAIKLIDRCGDHPELQAVWQAEGREPVRDALARYLETRMRSGQLRKVSNTRLAARMIIEVSTTWAIHIKWDRSPENFDPDEARENAIDFLVHSLAG
jgi:AcrR family transcriptional regulator